MNQIAKQVAVSTLLGAALLACGCGSDDDFIYNPIGLQPPVAVNDNYNVLGNGQLTVAAAQGVLTNDTPNGGTITAVQNPTALGGQVTVNADGSFTYTPPANQSNVADTFTYTLNNGFGTSTATVTVQIGARAIFIKNDAPAGGNGTFASPFNTLAAGTALLAANPGAQLVLFRGNGTSSGQNTPVVLGANQGIQAQDPANPPTITGPITLGSGSTLLNLRIVGTTGSDAVIGTGIVSATLQNLVVDQTSANAFNLTNPTGTVTMGNITATNIGRAVFPLSMSSGTLNLVANNWTATNTVGNVSESLITGAAVVNASFTSAAFVNLGAGTGTGFEWTVRNAANTTLRISNYSCDSCLNGVFYSGRDNSTSALVISGGNVTNGTGVGIDVGISETALGKLRLTNTRLLGNFSGLVLGTANTASLFARLVGNTTDFFTFFESAGSTILIENLNSLLNENTQTVGPTMNTGAENANVDTLGIPN